MSQNPPKIQAHLFICTHRRVNGVSCAGRGSEKLREEVKAACKASLKSESPASPTGTIPFRINSAGCLGRCEEGITAVLYPEGEWFTGLKPEDGERLIQVVKKCSRQV